MENNPDDYFNFLFSQQHYEPIPRNPTRHQEWVVDSGAAGNCTYVGDFMHDIHRISSRGIVCADGGRSSTTIEGSVDTHGLSIKNVLYIPAIDSNLLSVGCLTRDDHVIVFDKHGCEIYNEDEVLVRGNIKARGRLTEDGLYKLIGTGNGTDLESYNRNLWHRRLGHLDIIDMLILKNRMANGITIDKDDRTIQCLVPSCFNYFEYEQCPMFSSLFDFNIYPKATKALQLVYFYFATSVKYMSLNGNKHYMILIDDYTRKISVYFFKTEFEIIPQLKMFQKYVEMYTGNKIEQMWTDIDSSYKNFYPFVDSFASFKKIKLTYSSTTTPIFPWLKFYVATKKLCLSTETNLPDQFWAETINAIVTLLNVSPNTGHPNTTPQEAWSGRKPDLSVLRVFGCKAYLPCLRKYVIHLGYEFDKGEYRFMDVSHYGIYFRKTAIFYEDEQFWKKKDKTEK